MGYPFDSLVPSYATALGASADRPAALGDQKMIATLDRVQLDLVRVKTTLIDAKTVNQSLASGLTNAFSRSAEAFAKFAHGVGSFKDVLRAVRDSFLQFASDFLRHIAEMILQQLLLNALAKTPIGSVIANLANKAAAAAGEQAAGVSSVTISAAEAGAAAFADSASLGPVGLAAAPAAGAAAEALVLGTYLSQVMAAGVGAVLKHAGGIVGGVGGMSRSVDPGIFANARRCASGGIAGLNPGEVPTILKTNEEVLTESNPRHAFNQGKGGGAAAPAQPHSTKILNLFDAATVLSEAMNTKAGERAIINVVSRNPRAFKQAMSRGAGG